MFIDISLPITPKAVFRLGAPPVHIVSQRFFHESEGEFETTVMSFPAHTATHLDLVYKEKRFAPERMVSRGKLLDVTHVSEPEIRVCDIEQQVCIESRDVVLFRTGWSDFIDTEQYHDHPELSLELVEWLISKNINVVGIDTLGLGKNRKHGEYDRLLAKNDIFVLENLTNLSAVPRQEFMVYCFPLNIENIDAIPARVLVEI